MTLNLFCDGFDKYGPAGNLFISQSSANGDWATFNVGIIGPLSTYGYGIVIGAAAQCISNLFTSVSRIVGSVRMNVQSATTGAGIITLRNGTTACFTIEISQSNGVRLRTGTSAGAIIATATAPNGFTTFVLSFDVTIGASAAYDIKVDGSTVLSGTGNTGNGQSTANNILLSSGSVATFYDDLVMQNPADAAYDSGVLTNRVAVETQFPTADIQTQFTNDGDTLVPAGIASNGVCRVATNTNAPGAGQIFLLRCTAAISRTINLIQVFTGATSATAKFKPVIYSDSAGSPGTLLSDGVEVVGCTSGSVLTGPLVTPQAITAGSSYWIGFYTDTSVALWQYDNTTILGRKKANTYASGAPGSLSGMTAGQPTWLIWGDCTGSTANFLAVGRNPPSNVANSQVHSATIGQEDLFSFPALQTTPSAIYGVAVKAFASKSDAGTRGTSLNLKSGATDSTGSSANQANSTTKQWHTSWYDRDPGTGVAWTATGVNNASSGYSVAS